MIAFRPPGRLTAAAAVLLFTLAGAHGFALENSRATRYDGSSHYRYDDHPAFRPGSELTIEAWVWREETTRCETIISKGFQASWWLGFCHNLRFYAGRGVFVDSTQTVIARQWCHVAVTIDAEGLVNFYIDGRPAGGGQLPALVDVAGPLTVGADLDGGFAFRGKLDEIRLWNIVRAPADIGRGLFLEELGDPTQIARFPEGGPRESFHDLRGAATGTPLLTNAGMLPYNLCAPWFDGSSGGQGGLRPGDSRPLRYRCATEIDRDADMTVVHTFDEIWVEVGYLPRAQSLRARPGLAFFVDLELEDNRSPRADEQLLLVDLDNGSVQRFRGGGQQGYLDCEDTGDCPEAGLLDIAIIGDCTGEDFAACVSLRIQKSLLPPDTTQLRLGLWHHGVADPDEEPIEAFVPDELRLDDPTTWITVDLLPAPATGSGTCGDPFVMPTALPSIRVENLDGFPNEVDQAPCLPLPTTGPDAAYVFSAPEAGTYRATVRSLSEGRPDLALALSDCPSTASGCVAGSDRSGEGGVELVEFTLEAGETVSLLVDSHLDRDGAEPDLSEIELRIDRLLDPSLLVIEVFADSPEELEEARPFLQEVWEGDATPGRLRGTAKAPDARELERRGYSVDELLAATSPTSSAPRPFLRFERARYEAPATLRLELIDPAATDGEARRAWILTERSQDAEELTLEPGAGGWRASIELEDLPGGEAEALDGIVQASPGELLFAVLSEDTEASGAVVPALALVLPEGPSELVSLIIDPDVAPSIPELPGRTEGEAPRRIGALEGEDGSRLLLGAGQLIFPLADSDGAERDQEISRLLDELGDTAPRVVPNSALSPASPRRILVRLEAEATETRGVDHLLELLGLRGTLRVSDPATLGTLGLWLDGVIRGRAVMPNLVGTLHGWPRTDLDGEDAFQLPQVADCLQGTHQAWVFAGMHGFRRRDVRVAVIDRNFCPAFEDEWNLGGLWHLAPPGPASGTVGPNHGPGGLHHGTKMASIVGSHVNRGLDTAGAGGQVSELLLYNTDRRLLLGDVIDALDHAVLVGAEVVNMSFGFEMEGQVGDLLGRGFPLDPGGLRGRATDTNRGASGLLEVDMGAVLRRVEALRELEDFRAACQRACDAGVVLVASAGNDSGVSRSAVYPADYDCVISVGATDLAYRNTQRANSRVDVWVHETQRAYAQPDDASMNCEQRDLIDVAGSSAAAAYVSGIAALVIGVRSGLSPAGVKALLRAESTPRPGTDRRIHRFLRAGDAVVRAGTVPLGPVERLRSFAPSLGLDEDDASGAAACGGGITQLGDTPEAPIFIPFAEAVSPAGWVRRDAALHSFGDEDWYQLAIPFDAEPCTTYRVDVEVIRPEILGGAVDFWLPGTRQDRSSFVQLGPHFERQTWGYDNVLLDPERPFRFELEGLGVYELRVRVEAISTSSVGPDRYEPNETFAQAAVFGPEQFREAADPRFEHYRIELPALSFHCEGDVDLFRVELPQVEEICDVEIPNYCGSGVDEALEALKPRFYISGLIGELRLLDASGAEIVPAGRNSIECPRTNGHEEIFLEVRRNEREVRAYNYGFAINYRLPRTDVILQELAQEAGQIVCCDELPEGCETPTGDERYPPGAVIIEAFSPHDLEPQAMSFTAECEEDCESVEPTMYILYPWPGGQAPLHVLFTFPQDAPDDARIELLDGEHQIIAMAVIVDPDDPTRRRIEAGTQPEGVYAFRARGFRPGDRIDLENLEPAPLPDPAEGEMRIEPATIGRCGDLEARFVVFESEDALGGGSFGVSWDPSELAMERFEVGPDIDPANVFFFVANPFGPGQAGVGLVLDSTVDATRGLRAVTLVFRRAPGASGAGSEVCITPGLGDPPVEVILTTEPTPGDRLETVNITDYDCSRVIVSGDVEPPSIACPEDIEVESFDDFIDVSWEVLATDNCAVADIVCDPPSGSAFPLGTTRVICYARDTSGNESECSFEVRVSPAVARFLRGDATGDGSLNISDPVQILSFLFLGGFRSECPDAADANGDGTLDIGDPIWALRFLFLGGDPPPAPGPRECGVDPGDDDNLGECVYEACPASL